MYVNDRGNRMQPDPSSTQPVLSAPADDLATPPPSTTQGVGAAAILALVASLVAILAFFALPYYRITTRARPFAGYQPSGRGLASGVNALPAILHHPIFWLVPLAALVSFVFVLLSLFVRAIGSRVSGIVYLVSGIVGVVALLLGLGAVNNDVNAALRHAGVPVRLILDYGAAFGFWLTAAAMIALIVAGVLALGRQE